jgi:hypothetical protein
MERTSTTSINLARAGLAGLFVWSVYRAVTQAVTPGEARNYDRFIGPPWNESLARFDGNNHVLNTILVRISTARIHLTEFSLRLPSLIAGGLYLWAVYRLARRCFGNRALFLTVVGLLALNPMVVDAMSEARGYGLALTAWMWALDLLLDALQSDSASKFNRAGVLLGLGVGASLPFAAPALAMILAATAWRRKLPAYMPHLALLTAFILLAIPLNHVDPAVFGQGGSGLRNTMDYLTESVIAGRIAFGVLSAIALIAAIRARRRDPLLYLSAGSLVLTLLLLLASHRWLGTGFPIRAGVFLVPITVLSVATLAARWGRESAQVVFVVAAAFYVGHSVDHLSLPYQTARDLAGGRELAKALRADAMPRGVRIGVSDTAEPILRFYRWRYRQGNWQSIEAGPRNASYDYYVLTPADQSLVEERGLKVLYRDPGLVLAR